MPLRWLSMLCAATVACSGGGPAGVADGGALDGGALAGLADAGVPDGGVCARLSLPAVAFSDADGGTRRGDLAGDFAVPLASGETWRASEKFAGCETAVFVPDTLVVSSQDARSLWESEGGLRALVETSPHNVHYFFVSRAASTSNAAASVAAMQARVDGLVATLEPADAEHWRAHLHVVATRASALGGWLATTLARSGSRGFGPARGQKRPMSVDRAQRIRGTGSYADVGRFSAALQRAGAWPWEENLAYAAYSWRRSSKGAPLRIATTKPARPNRSRFPRRPGASSCGRS